MQLRPYQISGIGSIYAYLSNCNDNGLVIMPTGTGKSVVIGKFTKDCVSEYPQTRIIIATHSRELVAQNYQKLIQMWPDAPAGIHSAGLSKKDVHHRILFVSIQSVYKKAFILQRCDVLLVDECHTISRDAETMWGKFISDLRVINPHMRVLGFSATPYRMDSGCLWEGDGALFKSIAYEYGLLDAVKEGYLCEVVSKSMATKLQVSKAQMRSDKKIEEAVNVDEITKACVDEIFQYGQDRRSWLIFGSSVDHAIAIAAEITSRGVECGVITGDTEKGERDRILQRLKSGELRAVANNKVLTTGVDVPRIDLIAGLDPTESKGLLVQKLGRGMRPLYAPGYDLDTVEGRLSAIAASPKPNCLYLDFANNLSRHGCIDQIRAEAPPEGDGVAPIKDCPGKLPDGAEEWKASDPLELKCATILHAAAMTCTVCGFKFPEPELKISPTATTHAVLSTQVEREYKRVLSVTYSKHQKPGKKPSFRIDYMTEGFKRVSEWMFFEHGAQMKEKADRWWKRRAEGINLRITSPKTVDEAVALAEDLKWPYEIVTIKKGKYDEIIGYKFNDEVSQPTATVAKPQEEESYHLEHNPNQFLADLDDEISF